MSKSRRQFLAQSSMAFFGAVAAGPGNPQKPDDQTPGAPPAFGTSPPVGPEVSRSTFTEAAKLVQVDLTSGEVDQAAATWRTNLASVYERRMGPRKAALDSKTAPWSQWNPVLPGEKRGPTTDRFVLGAEDPGPLPAKVDEIAFAPITHLSRWIEQRKLTSEKLTRIYIDRIEKFDGKLRCVITLTRDLAIAQARKADSEIAAGKYRGPLHG